MAAAAAGHRIASPAKSGRHLALLLVGVWAVLAADGRHHWDEPIYLYMAAYFDPSSILDPGQYGYGFYASRILHLLFSNLIFSLTGPGRLGIAVVAATYSALVVAALLLGRETVRRLFGDDPGLDLGTALTLFAPTVLWLGGMTMPEAAGLFTTMVALYAYVRALEPAHPSAWLRWVLLAGTAAAVTLGTRNALLIACATFGATLLLFRGLNYGPRRVVLRGLAVAAVAGLVFAGLLWITGISLAAYFNTIGRAMSERASLAARLYVGVVQAGVLLLALPLALLHPRRREALFFVVWFALATAVVYLLLRDVETRYLLPNVPALLGLTCLAVGAVTPRLQRMRFGRVAGLTAVATTVVTAVLAQPIMEHEIVAGDVDRTIRWLDARYGGPTGYALLAVWNTDYHYLRVAYPDRRVLSVEHLEYGEPGDPLTGKEVEHFQGHLVRDRNDLARRPRPWLYYGFEYNFAVANLERIRRVLPHPLGAEAKPLVAGKMRQNHFESGWIRGDPHFRFVPVLRLGHYRVDEVLPSP